MTTIIASQQMTKAAAALTMPVAIWIDVESVTPIRLHHHVTSPCIFALFPHCASHQ
jgi:hypothetical protein